MQKPLNIISTSTQTLDNNPPINTIQSSWQKLLDTSRDIDQLAASNKWKAVTEKVISRRKFIHQHFDQYPVGPETASFYQRKLNWLFATENRIESIARHARAIVFRN